MRIRQGLMGLAALVVFGAQAAALTLVDQGEPASVIVIAEQANEASTLGAAEMQYHLEKMSGATVPIVTADAAPTDGQTALILIGRSALTDAMAIDPSDLAAEGYMVRTVGNALVLMGDDAKDPEASRDNFMDYHGTLYAVYDLLQEQLGCQWLWPGETGEHIPQRSTVEVGELDIVEEPALKRRHMRLAMNRDLGTSVRLLGDEPVEQLIAEELQWYRRMRMGRSMHPPAGHSFTDWWERFGDTHREVFAMLPNGERGPANTRKPDFVKMCVANPALWDLQIEEFKKAREADPSHHELPANENDGRAGFCTCELCTAWDATVDNLPDEILNKLDAQYVKELTPGKDGLPESLSTRYAKWFNEMARRVREVDPEGYVSGYAYFRFREAPLQVELEPNMLIGYVGFNTYPRTPAQSRIDRRDFRAWAQPGVRTYIRPNAPHYSGNGHPYSIARQIAEDLQYCIANGTIMADYDSMLGYWAPWGPSYYVVARLMWEGADVHIEDILDEWYGAFGPAERQVREYYDFWEHYIIAVKADPLNTRQTVPEIYTPEVMSRAREILSRAQAAAADADADASVKTKLENIELSLVNTELTAKAVELASKPRDNGENVAALKVALQELIDHRRAIAPRNVTNVYYQTSGEMGTGGYWKGGRLGWEVIADYTPEEGPPLE